MAKKTTKATVKVEKTTKPTEKKTTQKKETVDTKKFTKEQREDARAMSLVGFANSINLLDLFEALIIKVQKSDIGRTRRRSIERQLKTMKRSLNGGN